MDSVAGKSADPASMNRFLYAEGDPTTLVEPTGHNAYYEGEGCGPNGIYCGGTAGSGGQASDSAKTVADKAKDTYRHKAKARAYEPADPVTTPAKPAQPTTVDVHFVAGFPVLPNGQLARPEDYERLRLSSTCPNSMPDAGSAGGLCDAWWKTEAALSAAAAGQSADPVFLVDAALGTLDDAMKKAGEAKINLADTNLRIAFVDVSKQHGGDLSITGTGDAVTAAEWELTTGKVVRLGGARSADRVGCVRHCERRHEAGAPRHRQRLRCADGGDARRRAGGGQRGCRA